MKRVAITQADDGFVMALVDEALATPEWEREELVRRKCSDERDLFKEVWRRIRLELRLGGFLQEPFIPRAEIEHPFEPGQVLNRRFRISREIGRGGMGVVYEALDEKLNKRIAIKCAKPGFQRRLPPEARNATEINHPNVCRMYEIHTAATPHGEVDFLTMEYLDGETLAQLLERNGPLAANEACEILRQICAGLEEAHRKGVIHGDLKSSNIVLTKSGGGAAVPVITDFGLARRASGPVPSTLLASASGGTPAYMAPELWQGAKASVASDIYALGVVFYETLTGRFPRAVTEDVNGPLTSRPKLLRLPGIGRRLTRVLSKCLDSDPERRPARAAEIAIAITSCNPIWRLVRGAAAAAVLALAGPILLPLPTRDPVRLGILPFDAPQGQRAIVDSAVLNSSNLLSQVRQPDWRFSVIPLSETIKRQVKTPEQACNQLGATHVLQGRLQQSSPLITVTARVTAACSQQTLKTLVLEYAPSNVGSLPVGLTGIVTRTLHIPPIANHKTGPAPSNRDYVAGLKYLQNESQIDKAIASLERAAAVDPHAASIWAALAEAYRLKYNNITHDARFQVLAYESSRKAESLDPDSAAVCRITGILRLDSGQYARAEEDFKRSIELEPSNPGGYRRLAAVYQKSDQPQEALKALLRAIEVTPDDFESYKQLAAFYLELGEYEKAAKEYRAAIELNPGEPAVHNFLASAYIELGKYANAERELRIALRISESAVALDNLGVTLEYQGRNDEASFYERKATALSPNDFLPWLNLGESSRRSGHKAESDVAYHKALDLTLAGLKHNPQDAYIRAIRAYLLARVGERVQAEIEIKQATSFPAMDSQVLRAAALTYEALGLRQDTLAVLKDAPRALIADLSRHANMADLRRDPRFIELLASYNLP